LFVSRHRVQFMSISSPSIYPIFLSCVLESTSLLSLTYLLAHKLSFIIRSLHPTPFVGSLLKLVSSLKDNSNSTAFFWKELDSTT
jgi:hypothetical protein